MVQQMYTHEKNLYTKPNQAMEEEKSWNEFPLLLFNENEKKFLNELTAHRKQRKNTNFVVVPQASGSVNIHTTRIVLTQKHRRKKMLRFDLNKLRRRERSECSVCRYMAVGLRRQHERAVSGGEKNGFSPLCFHRLSQPTS